LNPLEQIGATGGAIALTLPRIVAAFMILPLLTADNMPSLARNSFYVSLAIVAYPIAGAGAAAAPAGVHDAIQALWPLLVVKELFLGTVFGFMFGSVFWAVSAAGNLIDTKVGSNFAASVDPLQGHETSLTGQLLTQLAAWLFMASGAFTLFLDLLMRSYALWPVKSMLPRLSPLGETAIIDDFTSLLTLSLLLSAPALVVLSLLDLSLGLVNRYAAQLNVFSLTMPVKAWVATWIVLLSLSTFVEVITRHLFANRALLNLLRPLL
jgi:type III secretion protein T